MAAYCVSMGTRAPLGFAPPAPAAGADERDRQAPHAGQVQELVGAEQARPGTRDCVVAVAQAARDLAITLAAVVIAVYYLRKDGL